MKPNYTVLALILSIIPGIFILSTVSVINYYETEKAKTLATFTDPASACYAVASTTTQKNNCAKLCK